MNLSQLTTLNGLDRPSLQLGKKVVRPVAALLQPTSVTLKPGLSVDSNGRMSYVPPREGRIESSNGAAVVTPSWSILKAIPGDPMGSVSHLDFEALKELFQQAVFPLKGGTPDAFQGSKPCLDGWYLTGDRSQGLVTKFSSVRYWNGLVWSHSASFCDGVHELKTYKNKRAIMRPHNVTWRHIRIIGPDTPENREAGLA